MSLIKKMRKQVAAVWIRNPEPDRYGQFTFQGPIEIKCRWDDGEQEFHDAQGQSLFASSTMYPDRPLKPGDFALVGPIQSDYTSDPRAVNAKEIVSFTQSLDFKGRKLFFTALLK